MIKKHQQHNKLIWSLKDLLLLLFVNIYVYEKMILCYLAIFFVLNALSNYIEYLTFNYFIKF